jgi:NADPH:quinone reductase-like Zn-dependent oxidoreductase
LAFWFRKSSAEQRRALFGEIVTLVAQGALSTPVLATYPVARIKEAIAAAATAVATGRS